MYLTNTISFFKTFSRLDAKNPYSILVFPKFDSYSRPFFLIKLPAVFMNIPHYLLFSSKPAIEDQLGPIEVL